MPRPENATAGPASGTRSQTNSKEETTSASDTSNPDLENISDSDSITNQDTSSVHEIDSESDSDHHEEYNRELEDMAENTTITPPPFSGATHEDATLWWNSFTYFCKYKKHDENQQIATFPLLLRGPALQWFEALEADKKDTLAHLKVAFENAFAENEASKWIKERDLFQQAQGPNQLARDYQWYKIQVHESWTRPRTIGKDDSWWLKA